MSKTNDIVFNRMRKKGLKMGTQLKKIFDAHKKTHWLHEYAEDGIVNFNDLQKIVKEFNSIPVEKLVSPKTADEDNQNLIELFWTYLRNIESRTKPEKDILDKIAVEDGYKIWNKIHKSKLKARWQE